jgi:hypothetical protein
MFREKKSSHPLSAKPTIPIQTTSMHSPIALQYKPINLKYETSFIYKPLTNP